VKFRANITKTGPRAKTVELGVVEVGGDDREMVLFVHDLPVLRLDSPRLVTCAAHGLLFHGFERDGQDRTGRDRWAHAEVFLRDAGGGAS
jgi:hypothetical protein